MGEPVLKTPVPYPGGKARVADLVWSRLGNVDNYVGSRLGVNWTLAVFGMPTRSLGFAFGGPPEFASRGDCLSDGAIPVVVDVLRKMRCLRHHLKVVDYVVQLVAVLVVHDHPARQWSVVFFPNELRAEFPDVRLRNLDPCAFFTAAIVSRADANRPDREGVIGSHALQELTASASHTGIIRANYVRDNRRCEAWS